MAYNVVPTQITGDSWTAGNNNTYLRDNFKVCIPDIFTAAGDISFATGANIADSLAIGEAREKLIVDSAGTAPEYTGIIGCSLYDSTSYPQTLLGTTAKKIPFDTEIFDTNNFWSSADDDAVIIPFDGVYKISGVIIGNNTIETVVPVVTIYLGPSDTIIMSRQEVIGGSPASINYLYIGKFSAGDDVYLKAKLSNDAISATVRHNVIYLGSTG